MGTPIDSKPWIAPATWIKFCGTTTVAEAALAERCGADAIGVLVGQLHASRDFVAPQIARDIALAVGPRVTVVMVTHLTSCSRIAELADAARCVAVQAHGELAPTALAELRERLRPRRLLGRVGVEDASAIERAIELEPAVDAIVVDSIDRAAGRIGGTGIVHDWSVSREIVRRCRVPVILAGGLTPANVAAAIAAVRPWGVDVHTGVEDPVGRKLEAAMREFVRAVRSVVD